MTIKKGKDFEKAVENCERKKYRFEDFFRRRSVC